MNSNGKSLKDRMLMVVDFSELNKDGKVYPILKFLALIILVFRHFYSECPVLLSVLLGIPLFIHTGAVPYAFYVAYILWTQILDRKYHYDYSPKTFSIREYFKVYFIKNFLFIVIFFMLFAASKSLDYFTSYLYAIIMLIITVGYIVPMFDKCFYKTEK